MFVSCNPTVLRTWPRPYACFFYLHKTPKKHCFHNNLLFFVQTGFSSDFANKISFSKKQKQKQKNKTIRPTYPNFFGHVTGNKHLFFEGLTLIPRWSTVSLVKGNGYTFVIKIMVIRYKLFFFISTIL